MEYQEQIEWVLTSFFKIAQMEALYVDSQMNITSCQLQAHTREDFLRLSGGELEAFLRRLFAGEGGKPADSYIYYLRHNFICNISVVKTEGRSRGAIVAQPILLNTLKKDELKSKFASLPPEERHACIAAMLRAPVIPQSRVVPIGGTLNLLTQHIFGGEEFNPVVCGGETDPLLYQLMQPDEMFSRQHSSSLPDRFDSYPTYLQIKEAITKGDSEALLAVFDRVNKANIPMDQHASKDIMRSIKNRLIESCAMCGFFAIEAQAPYDKTRSFIKRIIREIEHTDHVGDLYNLMRSALKTMTRYVARARISGYSKHTRFAAEYIEAHFAEDITLETLAQVTGISKYYLSTLIKKETGFSFTEMLNRVRVEESKRMLAQSNIRLAAVSSGVGFANSNYFSKVFKRQTGMTPMEFSKTIANPADEEVSAKDLLRALLGQLSYTMELLAGVFDAGRIVDPVQNKAWSIHPSGKMLESTCYDFWERAQSCDRCISRMALTENKSFVKLDQGASQPFLVSATPVAVGGTRYVIELLKKIEGNFLDGAKDAEPARNGCGRA